MTKHQYAQKLKDPRWQQRRLQIFESAEFKCEDCGDDKTTLHAHHCIYINDREPWDYSDECFRCICEKCHKRRHELEKAAVLEFKIRLAAKTGNELRKLIAILREARECGLDLSVGIIPPYAEKP